MSGAHLFLTCCLAIFVGNTYVISVQAKEPQNSQCTINNGKCRFSWECCSGCCNNGICDTKSETCVQDQHPCVSASKDCLEGETCRLYPVQCIQAPCPPLPSCSIGSDPNPCMNLTCATGSHCELNGPPLRAQNCGNPALCAPRKAVCVRDCSCDKKTCPRGSTCVMSGKRPVCVASCDGFVCRPGTKCSLQLVNGCTWDRCDLRPTCVPYGGSSSPGKVTST